MKHEQHGLKATKKITAKRGCFKKSREQPKDQLLQNLTFAFRAGINAL